MDCTEIQLKVETGASYDIRWLQEEEMVYKTLWYYFKIITKTNGIENWRWKERMKCFKLLIHRVCDRPIYIAFLKNKYMIYFINKKKRQFWVVACQRYRGYCYGRFVFAPWCLSVFFKSSTISMYFFFFIVVQVQFSAFSLHPSPTLQPSPQPSHFHPTRLIVHVSFIIVPTNPSPCSPAIPSTLPYGHCQPVLNFSVFGYVYLSVFLIMFLLKARSYGICLSLPALFHIAYCSPVPSTLSQRVGAPSFFLLHRSPLCKCTIVFWSIHLLMGT